MTAPRPTCWRSSASARYFAHGAWLEEGVLLRHAGSLASILGMLIHGHLDLSCPLDIAWELARAWPDAELVALADSGLDLSPGWRHTEHDLDSDG